MTNRELSLKARAKINLALDVLYKRDDGYHEVAMVMQSIALADTVGLAMQPEGITVTADIAGLDCGPSNLAYRAAALLQEACGVSRGVRITLTKNIPLAAGLAGGSADAAAVLRGLNVIWGLGLELEELERLGAKLGSDVPFCLSGGTQLATGRGEALSPLPPLPRCWVVLAKLPVDVSTAWVYGDYDAARVHRHPEINGMKAALARQDIAGVAGLLGNVLETVTIPAHPEIARLKQYMLEYGALASLMSGSGPTVFGLAENRDRAGDIAARLAEVTTARIIITETVSGVEGENGTTVGTN